MGLIGNKNRLILFFGIHVAAVAVAFFRRQLMPRRLALALLMQMILVRAAYAML